MVHKITFRPAAVTDLKRIYLSIARVAGHQRAGDYIGRIEAACLNLSVFPERGTERNHIHPGLRIVGFERSASIALSSMQISSRSFGYYRVEWTFRQTGWQTIRSRRKII